MSVVRVAWLHGPGLAKPMFDPPWEEISAAIEQLGTATAYSVVLYTRWNLDNAVDLEMEILGWTERFHVQVVDNNLSEEDVYCYRGGPPDAVGDFMFPVEGDFVFPLTEVITDRGVVKSVVKKFWTSGFQYDPSEWVRYGYESEDGEGVG